MIFRPLKRKLVIAGAVLVGMDLASLLTTGQPDWHPENGALWQSHYWVIDTPVGELGLEEWRLEGINSETSVCLGSFQFSTMMPAIAVVAIGLGGFSAAYFLCVVRWHTIFQAREHDANTG